MQLTPLFCDLLARETPSTLLHLFILASALNSF